ncbi:hypothetical protein [Flavobacterium sp.]|uniref:hypothetical protein n=1 Tax=Flavobacterium sp. TaxID=239 RepID=UPI00260D89AD|nr:hypothetical protein [Flavobacterium sp.]
MKVILLTPMEIEAEKVQNALQRFPSLQNDYQIVISGVGRETTAKAMMHLPAHDLCVLIGFAAIVGKPENLPAELQLGMPIEITNASLYGYEGQLFENGKPILTEPKTNLLCLSSLTSDKFVKTTNLAERTVVNMEDYTFMYLKQPQDFIVRIISDFLPHTHEIDFFEEVKPIDFYKAIEAIDRVL